MKYEPYKTIEESFRRHMIPGGDLETAYEEYKNHPGRKGAHFWEDAEEFFINQFDHNMEYFTFYPQGATGEVVFGDSNGPYHPLGFFYGMDAGIPAVQQELTDYIYQCRQHLLRQIITSMYEIQKQRVPVEEIQVPRPWRKLIPSILFGAKVITNRDSKVISDSCYGRFVPIAGLED